MADISTIQFDGDDTIYNIKDTKARNNLAASYSSSSTYQVGDIVIYNGELYKCITAVSTAEEWDETKWQQTTVGSAIGSIDDSSKEDKANKVTSLSSSSTDTQYPSAKCVYDIVGDIESILEELDIGGGVE